MTDDAYTYDKLILSPTTLADTPAKSSIRGYINNLQLPASRKSKTVINPLVYPSTSYDYLTKNLDKTVNKANLLFVNESGTTFLDQFRFINILLHIATHHKFKIKYIDLNPSLMLESEALTELVVSRMKALGVEYIQSNN